MKRLYVRSDGAAWKPIIVSANLGAGRNRARPSVSTSTSRISRSGRSIAKRAAIAPPSTWPTITGGSEHVRSISSSSQASIRSTSRRPSSGTPEAPCAGRSGAMTRFVEASCGITRIHFPANSPGPCRSMRGEPSPACRTEVVIPASCRRRSEPGIPASSRPRAFVSGCDPPGTCQGPVSIRGAAGCASITAPFVVGIGDRTTGGRVSHRPDRPTFGWADVVISDHT
jgi:hypothetical protein